MRHLVLLAAIGLAGCDAIDPLHRAGLWQPNGANGADLALQVANPADLVRGTGATTTDGQVAAAAVARLREDKVKKLPASDVSDFQQGNAGGQ